MYGEDGVDVLNTKYLDKFEFLEQNFNSLITTGSDIVRRTDSEAVPAYKKATRRHAKLLKKADPALSSKQALAKASDPLLSLFHPQKFFGAISERVAEGLDKYTKEECQSVKVASAKGHLLKRKYEPIQAETFA